MRARWPNNRVPVYGGYLGYDYSTTTYLSGLSYRDVAHRYLSKDGTTQTTEPSVSTNLVLRSTEQCTRNPLAKRLNRIKRSLSR
jgi:hypothetical protein